MKPLLKFFPFLLLTMIQSFNQYDDHFNYSDEPEPWKKISEKGDLKVYKRTRPGTNLKEVRIDYVFHVNAKKLLDELDDAGNYTEWIYKCGEAKVISKPAKNEIIYYTLANVPSPIWDRDIVAHSVYQYFPEEKIHYYESSVPENDEELEPVRKKVVRVKDYGATWTIKEVEENKIETINTIYMDPGGSIPNWLANMTISKGPIKSMKALEKRLMSNVEE